MKPMLQRRLTAQDGVFTAAEARACGYDKHSLARLAGQREVVRVRTGAYVDARLWQQASTRKRHVLRARAILRTLDGDGLALSHHSALAAADLPLHGVDLETVHLTRRSPGRSGRRAGLWVHPPLVASAFVSGQGGWRVHPAVAVVQTADAHGAEAGVVAADAALRTGEASRDQLGRSLSVARLGRGHADARMVVALADGLSESPGESLARLLFIALGLPQPRLQARVCEPDGLVVARVDFLFADQRTVVEFDGAVKYEGAGGRTALVREKRREDRLRALGYQVVRLTWPDLDDPRRVLGLILGAFARAGA